MAATSFSLRSIPRAQRQTLIAAGLGWMLDSFDVMLYTVVLTYVMRDLGMSKSMGGFLITLTLLASGIGGVLFGFVADSIGRKRALILSILTFSLCSFGSGLSTSVAMLAAFRFVLGLGMGGEWNTGATLVAETWPTALRAKALAVVQSSWAIGFAISAVVAGAMLRVFHENWRLVFFVGIVPALVVLWIQARVPESTMWKEMHAAHAHGAERASIRELFSREYAGKTFALLFLNLLGMFAWWGLFTWVPSFLRLPPDQGGRGFSVAETTTMLVFLNLLGMFPGYASFGWVADHLGRRKSFAIYLILAAILVPLYGLGRNPTTLLLLGAPVAFFGTGFFSGSSIVGSEIFPTRIRARALGFTYNGARMMSSTAPFIIGWVGEKHGLGGAFLLCSVSFFLAFIASLFLPETKGKHLD